MCPALSGQNVERSGERNTYTGTLEIGLETDKVTDEPVQQEVIICSSKASIDQGSWIDGRSQGIVGERVGYICQGLESVTPSDAVRAWVYPDNVLEASRRDLGVVVGISPSTKSAYFIVVEHRRVLGVEGIWYGMRQNMKSSGNLSKDIPRVQSQYGVVPV